MGEHRRDKGCAGLPARTPRHAVIYLERESLELPTHAETGGPRALLLHIEIHEILVQIRGHVERGSREHAEQEAAVVPEELGSAGERRGAEAAEHVTAEILDQQHNGTLVHGVAVEGGEGRAVLVGAEQEFPGEFRAFVGEMAGDHGELLRVENVATVATCKYWDFLFSFAPHVA